MLDQPIPAPQHRIPLGSYSGRTVAHEIEVQSSEIFRANKLIADHIDALIVALRHIGTDYMSEYEPRDLIGALHDMRPQLDDATQLARIDEIARDRVADGAV